MSKLVAELVRLHGEICMIESHNQALLVCKAFFSQLAATWEAL